MLAYWFVLLAVAVRFLPHPLAFTPVAAALLFLEPAARAGSCLFQSPSSRSRT